MKRADKDRKKRWRLLVKVADRLCLLGTSWDCGELARLTLEQLEFINHRLDVPCYLAACPGSGKTEVVGIKAAYEFSTWTSRYCGIAILTFTKSAASQISERVMKYGGINASRHPHFIGTFDSWLHNYIFQPFGHLFIKYTGRNGDKKISVIDDDSRAGFLQGFKTKVPGVSMPVFANQFSYSATGIPETTKEELVTIIEDVQNREELKRCKVRFLKSGFATYQDAECISYKVLTTRKDIAKYIAKRFPVIVVDECQDLSPAELKILEQLQAEGVAVHLVGDLDQAIYEFRKVDPVLVREYCKQQKLLERELTNNFRSNQQIVDLCQKIIGKDQAAKGAGKSMCSPQCVLYEYTDLTMADLPTKFKELIDALGLNPSKCAILARGNTTLSKIAPQNDKKRKAVELFAAALDSYFGTSRKTDDLTNALDQIGKSIAYLAFDGKGNHQRQYCPDEIDPVQWRMFLWELLRRSSSLFPFEDSGAKLTWSGWVSKLKQFLQKEWATLPFLPTAWGVAETKIRASSGTAKEQVIGALIERQRVPRVRTTTIHDAKGETLDAVLLVSSPDKRSQGGHFEHWIRPASGNEEHRRFAYVACSRPRHLLIIAAKKLKAKDKNDLISLGLAPTVDLIGAVKKLPEGDSISCPTVADPDVHTVAP